MRQLTSVETPEADSIIDENEVSKRLGLAKRTTVTRRLRGEIPYLRVGRLVRYYWPDVVAALRRNSPKHGGVR